jgi:hypothetical protein
MSHRFPPIASQETLANRAQVKVLTRPQMPSLPWVELAIGVAVLLLLRGA